jgi:hypothetical protein
MWFCCGYNQELPPKTWTHTTMMRTQRTYSREWARSHLGARGHLGPRRCGVLHTPRCTIQLCSCALSIQTGAHHRPYPHHSTSANRVPYPPLLKS